MAKTTDKKVYLLVDMSQDGLLDFQLIDDRGQILAHENRPYEGHVDNILLTVVDNLLKRSKLHKSALTNAEAGQGIDKNSSLYRIVRVFSSVLAEAQRG